MMSRKVFAKQNSLRQLSWMVSITICTQFFILLKNSIVAAKFGVSPELDAFNFANSISSFIYSFIGAGVSTILMPNLADDRKQKSIHIFITAIYSAAFLVLVILLLFRHDLIAGFSGVEDGYFVTVASNLLFATMIAGFLNSLVGLVSGVLEFKGQFNRLRMIGLGTSVLVVIALQIVSEISIYYLASVIVLITFISVGVYLVLLQRSGFKFQIDFEFGNPDFKRMIQLFVPTILSQGVYQVSILIDTMISARLGVGQVSLLTYSNAIIMMVNLLILSNITAFMYPRLIRVAQEPESQHTLSEFMTIINMLMCGLVTLMFVVGKEGITFLYERGNFTTANTEVVYLCVLLYALSLPANAVRDLIYKYFYIQQDTLSPFRNSLVVSCLNIVISLILSRYFGLYGVISGTVIASFVSLMMIFWRFRKSFGITIEWKNFIKENGKIVLVAVLTIGLGILVKNQLALANLYVEGVIGIVTVISVFVGLLFLTKSTVFKIKW
jgi:putative peptidoglycan lipid II flippase